jgi:hypothetical protein
MDDPFESQEWMIGGAGFVGEEDDLGEDWAGRFELISKAKAATKVLSLSVDADGYEGVLIPLTAGLRGRACGSSTPKAMLACAWPLIARA